MFTNTLSPILEKTASEAGSDVRIVNVSICIYVGAKSNADRLQVASGIHPFIKHTDFTSIQGFNETYASEYFASFKVYGRFAPAAAHLLTDQKCSEVEASQHPMDQGITATLRL